MSAFANCGRAVAHVQGSYVPATFGHHFVDLEACQRGFDGDHI